MSMILFIKPGTQQALLLTNTSGAAEVRIKSHSYTYTADAIIFKGEIQLTVECIKLEEFDDILKNIEFPTVADAQKATKLIRNSEIYREFTKEKAERMAKESEEAMKQVAIEELSHTKSVENEKPTAKPKTPKQVEREKQIVKDVLSVFPAFSKSTLGENLKGFVIGAVFNATQQGNDGKAAALMSYSPEATTAANWENSCPVVFEREAVAISFLNKLKTHPVHVNQCKDYVVIPVEDLDEASLDMDVYRINQPIAFLSLIG